MTGYERHERVEHGANMADLKDAVDDVRAGAQGVAVEHLAPMTDAQYEHAAFCDSPEVWAWYGAPANAPGTGRAR
jgi:hypothetical protein